MVSVNGSLVLLIVSCLHFVIYKTNMEKMRKIISVHILRSAASQRHYNKFRAGLTLIPLWTNPHGMRTVSERHPDGSGQFWTALVGPDNRHFKKVHSGRNY